VKITEVEIKREGNKEDGDDSMLFDNCTEACSKVESSETILIDETFNQRGILKAFVKFL
jgi:hypothetical protein